MHGYGGLTERLAAVFTRWSRMSRNFVSGAAYGHDGPLQSTASLIRNDGKKGLMQAETRVSLRCRIVRLEGPLSLKAMIQDQEQASLNHPIIDSI